jgi:hypothetical protein
LLTRVPRISHSRLCLFHLLLIALLPENYKPAPRETKADLDGTVNTLDRKLKGRVYLMIGDSFPTTEVAPEGSDDEESLLEAALRGLGEHISTTGKKSKQTKGEGKDSGDSQNKLPLDLYCPSQAPLAVKLDTFDPDQQTSTGFFGIKTFFVKVQYDDGKISNKNIDFAWLDRSEIVERVKASFGEEEAKFYQYIL